MIFCRHCEIAMTDDTVRCPMCGRKVRTGLRRLLIGGGALAFCLILGLGLWGSGRIKNRVQRSEISNDDVLKVAKKLVATNPAVRNAVSFSGADQTRVEHWNGRRWRVSGYIDTQPEPGLKVRTLYFAVLLNNGANWNLEDLQLQSMEFGSRKARRN